MEHRFQYLRDAKGQPVGCVAIKIKEANSLDNCTVISFQLSVLNPVDKFDRELARSISLARLHEKPSMAILIGGTGMYRITRTVMIAISSNKTFPARAVKAAKAWLKNQEKFGNNDVYQ